LQSTRGRVSPASCSCLHSTLAGQQGRILSLERSLTGKVFVHANLVCCLVLPSLANLLVIHVALQCRICMQTRCAPSSQRRQQRAAWGFTAYTVLVRQQFTPDCCYRLTHNTPPRQPWSAVCALQQKSQFHAILTRCSQATTATGRPVSWSTQRIS